MKFLKTYESFNEETRRFDKQSLKEMAEKVYEIIRDDERVIDSFVWGSYFEKEDPKDIDIVIKLNTAIGQFDDKIKELSELQKEYVTIQNEDGYQYPLDLTVVDSNDEAFLLFATSTENVEESPERTESYNNLDESRPIKQLAEMFE
jgi:predicted nucleotidyltransferase